jgi:Family of unknown function (DUF6011)
MTQLRITPLNRPVERFDLRRAEIMSRTPEEKAEEAAWRQQREALHAEFEREWVRPEGYSREREYEEFENLESAAFDAWKERRAGRTTAATTPVWMDAFEYWLIDGVRPRPDSDANGMLAQQPTAASLVLPIVLKGGGEMRVTFETRKSITSTGEAPSTYFERKLGLTVRTEHGVFKGSLNGDCSERSWYVVSLPPNAPQAVADRIATTLDAIQKLDLKDDYLAIMPVSDRCGVCSRALDDIVSKTLGIGRTCAARLGIRHSAAVADEIIVRRRAFLAEEIAS